MPHEPRSLRSLIATLSGLALVPVLLLAPVVGALFAQEQRRSLEGTLATAAGAARALVDTHVSGYVRELRGLASLVSGDSQPGALRSQLITWAQANPEVAAVYITDGDGRMLASSLDDLDEPPAAVRLSAALPRQLPQDSDFLVSDLVDARASNDIAIAVALGSAGAPDSHLMAIYHAYTWQNVLEQLRVPPEGIATIVDRNGLILARTRDISSFLGHRANEMFLKETARQPSGVVRSFTVEGDPVLVAYDRAGDLGWTVSIALPASHIDQPVQRSMMALLVGGALVAALILLLALRPMRALQTAAAQLAADARAIGAGAVPQADPIAVRELYEAALALRNAAIERSAAQQARDRHSLRIEQLHTLDRAILAAGSLADTAQAAVSGLRRLIEAPRASFVLFHEEAQEGEILAYETSGGVRLPVGARFPLSVYGDLQALARGELGTLDFTTLPQDDFVRATLAEGIRILMLIPLTAEGHLLGLLTFGLRDRGDVTEEKLATAREAADQLSIAVRQTQLRDQLRQRAEELEQRVIERTHALQERTGALQEANHDLEAYAYMASHDLREPIRAQQGFVQALIEDYSASLDDKAVRYLERILAAARRMDRLTTDLLDFSRLGQAQLALERVPVAGAVFDALRGLDMPPGAELRVELPMPQALAHRATLALAVRNLLQNALKFHKPGEPPRILVRAEVLSEEVRLWVEDHGIGIPDEARNRIFRPFERLHGHEEYPGTGIGLAIVARAVQKMGGRSGVEAQAGGATTGTRFWIALGTSVPNEGSNPG